WNYVYADSVTTCMTITGGVTVSVPILSRGNICLTSGGHFINPGSTSTATLIAGGTVTDTGGSNIGTSSSPVAAVEAAGCTSWNTDGSCAATTSTSCTVQQTTVVSVVPGTGVCNGLQT